MEEIKKMRGQFEQAFSGTSFSPDKRADSCVKQYSEMLASDLASLPSAGNYKEKFLAHLSRCMGRKGRTMSHMIAGPANFPVYRNIKAIEAEMRAWDDFARWRERYIKRANAVHTPTPEEEIDDALAKLDRAKEQHQIYLDSNKILRMKIETKEKVEKLKELGIEQKEIESLFKYGPHTYRLAYSKRGIKSLEEKLETMRARIKIRDSFEAIKFDGGEIDIENNRVVIRHDEKPAREVIQSLKDRGFRWSPHWKCWCRKHTANALAVAKEIVGVKE